MRVDQDELEQIIAAIERAPFSKDGWHTALEGAVRAGGGWGVQMVAQSATGDVYFDVGVEIDPEIIDTYEDKGTSNPVLSPRTRAALYSKPLATFCEADFITPEERARHPMYQEVHLHYNAAYVCGARLSNHNGMLTGLGVLRSERQGHTGDEERRTFAAIVPHLDAAFRLQMKMEQHAAAMAAGAFQAHALVAIFCDASGRAVSTTPYAEATLTAGECLMLVNRRLIAATQRCQKDLDAAIARTLALTGSLETRINAVPLRNAAGELIAVAEVTPLPKTGLLGLGSIMVLLKPVMPQSASLRQSFDLTTAEVEIARLAMRGGTARQIAQTRGTTMETVRSQLRTIYGKMGVQSRAEMIVVIQSLEKGA